jgi:hypothetical protein
VSNETGAIHKRQVINSQRRILMKTKKNNWQKIKAQLNELTDMVKHQAFVTCFK